MLQLVISITYLHYKVTAQSLPVSVIPVGRDIHEYVGICASSSNTYFRIQMSAIDKVRRGNESGGVGIDEV